MLAFKRRNDGFEWHRYVRTTLRLKRQDRREKIVKAKDAAVSGLKQAGKAGATAGTGLIAAAFDALLSLLALLWHWITQVPGLIVRVLSPVFGLLARLFGLVWRMIDDVAGRSPVRLAALGGVALGGTWVAARVLSVGFGAVDVQVALGIAALSAFLLAVPVLSEVVPGAWRVLTHGTARLGVSAATVAAVLTAGVVAAGAWFAWAPLSQNVRSGASAVAGLVGLSGPEIKGRATVAGPTSLVVGGTTVRLAGLEAPVADQTCPSGADRNRKCAAYAQSVLGDIVRGQQVVCEVVGGGGDALRSAICKTGGNDVAGQLVSRGAGFADQSLFARYGAEDRAARAAKAGIWKGPAERPSDYKARLVEAARKTAPNGCVIKGTIAGGAKRFLQPWDGDYTRAKPRTDRGEKWFCSEDEAVAAGFKPANRA